MTVFKKGDHVMLSPALFNSSYGRSFGARRGVITSVLRHFSDDAEPWYNVRWDGRKTSASFQASWLVPEADFREVAAQVLQREDIIP